MSINTYAYLLRLQENTRLDDSLDLLRVEEFFRCSAGDNMQINARLEYRQNVWNDIRLIDTLHLKWRG